jgi:hypothetical protein
MTLKKTDNLNQPASNFQKKKRKETTNFSNSHTALRLPSPLLFTQRTKITSLLSFHLADVGATNQQLTPHCPIAAAFWLGEMNGSMRTQRSEKIDARRIAQTITIVGVLF